MSKTRKDGRKCVTFTYNRKRYYCYGGTQKEARENAEKRKQELKSGERLDVKKYTIRKYSESWLNSMNGIVKESTINEKKSKIRCVNETVINGTGLKFGDITIEKIQVEDIKDLQRALTEKGLKATTVNSYISLYVRHMFNDLVKEHVITWNPCKAVKPIASSDLPATETIHRALTIDETRRFFEEATKENSFYITAFKFMLFSGCRLGECGAVFESDIDRKNGMLHIRRTISKTEGGSLIVGKNTKTSAGKRDIPLTPQLLQALDERIAFNRMIYGNTVIDVNTPIFKGVRGTLLSGMVIEANIKKICENSGIDVFTAHAFRDTFATRAIESGMNPKTLQVILGHSNINMTMNLYAHVMQETKIAEMNAITIAI